MMRWMAMASCLVCGTGLCLRAAPLARPYTVENYDVSVQADLAKQRLHGEAGIRLHSTADTDISALELDAGGLEIASVMEGQAPQPFERGSVDGKHGLLFVVLTRPLRTGEARTITIRYQAGPAAGLKFFSDQIYTTNASDWMPCNDRPGERATLHLTISAPLDTKTAASGLLVTGRAMEGQSITEWQLDSPTEPAWFGFALGAFTENTFDADGVKLRALGGDAKTLDPTAAAVRYLNERTGKHYPGQTYTQVFVHGDAARAMAAGLTLLPDSYAQGLAKQPEDLWLLTDELAHQWYGIGIAAKDWSDLWLSEGISAYMADTFLGQKFGKERYEREVARSRDIFKQLTAQGKDRSLSDAEGTATRQDAAGQIPEHKGAWFLHLVSQLTGDNAFWNGVRLYTSDEWGMAATSENLQRAFDATSAGSRDSGKEDGGKRRGRSAKNGAKTSVSALDNLFDEWVYGLANTSGKRRN